MLYKGKPHNFNKKMKFFSGTWRNVLTFAFLFLFIGICCILNQLNASNTLRFKITPQQLKLYHDVQLLRDNMIFRKVVENNVLSKAYPIMYRRSKKGDYEESFYGLAAEAEDIGLIPSQYVFDSGYMGPINLQFGRTNTAKFDISPREYLYSRVLNIRNYAEHGPEFYACASFEVRTKNSRYKIKVTQGCEMLKDLLYRWGSASRQFRQYLPKILPPEAHGATGFGITFQREQPCHMAVNYYGDTTGKQDSTLLYSVPLKDVTYKLNHKLTPGKNCSGTHLDLTGTYFDGSVLEMRHLSYTYIIEQSVKKYHESNRFYALKTKIPEDKIASIKVSQSGYSTIDTDMWVHGVKFKYNAATKMCYTINIGTVVFLHKHNAEFFVDRKNGKIVFNLYVNDDIYFLTEEKYTLLIENDAKLCKIPSRNMTQN